MSVKRQTKTHIERQAEEKKQQKTAMWVEKMEREAKQSEKNKLAKLEKTTKGEDKE